MIKIIIKSTVFILLFVSFSFGQDLIEKKELNLSSCSAKLSSDNSKLFILNVREVVLIDVKTLNVESTFPISESWSFCITPDGKYLTTGSRSHVVVWNTEKKTKICEVQVSSPFMPGAHDYVDARYITNDGKYVVFMTEMYGNGILDVDNQTYNLVSNEIKQKLEGFPINNNKIISTVYANGCYDLFVSNIGKNIVYTDKILDSAKSYVPLVTCGNNIIFYSFKNKMYQIWDAGLNEWRLICQLKKEYQANPYLVSNKFLYTKCIISTYTSPEVSYPRTINDLFTGETKYTFSLDDCKDNNGAVVPDVYVKPIEDDSKLLVVRPKEIRIYDISKLKSSVINTELYK